jgi:hypothetical protein
LIHHHILPASWSHPWGYWPDVFNLCHWHEVQPMSPHCGGFHPGLAGLVFCTSPEAWAHIPAWVLVNQVMDGPLSGMTCKQVQYETSL